MRFDDVLMIILIGLLTTAVGFVFISVHSDGVEREEYCEREGWDGVYYHNTRIFGGPRYHTCYSEVVHESGTGIVRVFSGEISKEVTG